MKKDFELLLKDYQHALGLFRNQQLSRNYLFCLGMPCQILQMNGISPSPFWMFQRTLNKMLKKHELIWNEIALLPYLLSQPLAVYRSRSDDFSRVVLAESEYSATIVLVISSTEHNGVLINEVKSAYPKESESLAVWEAQGLKIWPKK